jgi:hypothetical protein
MNNLFRICLFVCAIAYAQELLATERKVFFIGNSYTYTNNMPVMLRDFATAKGDTLTYAMSAPGGYTFQQHTTNSTTLSGIYSQQWDIVVLQEQSQMPAFPPAQVATDVYPFARQLDSLVHDNDTCTQTMFMMTWGRRNGDVMNCPSYPAVCTYAGMQGRLRESYMQMAQDNNAIVAPMGAAWKIVIDSFPTIDLYQTDSSHPSVSGSYLQACVAYASIFHKPASGCTYLGGLSASTAGTLQRIADKVVLDSLSQWQQYGHYPFASFAHTPAGVNALSFANHSQQADQYYWSFGDGGTDTAVNPGHTYASPGVYTVALTVSTNCFSVTIKDTVHVGVLPSAIEETEISAGQSIRILNSGSGGVGFVFDAKAECHVLEVYDVAGRHISTYQQPCGVLTDQYAPGLYFFRAYAAGGAVVARGRFSAF